MKRWFWSLGLCAVGCIPELLLERDAGVVDAGAVVDAGVVDAGFVEEPDGGEVVDAGPQCAFEPPLCAIEPFEVPFECEGDEDWCEPRDQVRAWGDLAAVWSRREDNAWVIEVRTWGRMPFFDGQHGLGELRIVWQQPGDPIREFRIPSAGTADDCQPVDPNYYASGFDYIRMSRTCFYSFHIFCVTQNQPQENERLPGEIVDRGGCLRWSISDDFSTWQLRIPEGSAGATAQSLFSVELLLVDGEEAPAQQCVESTGFLMSRGGAASATFQPLSAIEPACLAR